MCREQRAGSVATGPSPWLTPIQTHVQAEEGAVLDALGRLERALAVVLAPVLEALSRKMQTPHMTRGMGGERTHSNKPHVVILGGGYAGAYAARHLDRDPRLHLTLIDAKQYLEDPVAMPWAITQPGPNDSLPQILRFRLFLWSEGFCSMAMRSIGCALTPGLTYHR
jgi:hypothetical protein